MGTSKPQHSRTAPLGPPSNERKKPKSAVRPRPRDYRCLAVRLRGREDLVEAANLPANDKSSLELFLSLLREAGDDCFMTADGRQALLADVIAVKCDGVEHAVEPATISGGARRLYKRLVVPLKSAHGASETVANIPADANGLALFQMLKDRYVRDCDERFSRSYSFMTTDYGWLEFSSALPDERKNGETARLAPEDILRPEDCV